MQGYAFDAGDVPAHDASPQAGAAPGRRALSLVFLALPVVVSGASYLAGGAQALTDLAFLMLTIVCAALMVYDLLTFPRNFAIGRLVLNGGVLVWFCIDYLRSWFNADLTLTDFTAMVLAKACFYHTLFVLVGSMGLMIPRGRRAERVFTLVPEPATPTFYFWLMLFFTLLGLLPYILWSTDPFPVALYKAMTGGYGSGTQWSSSVARGATINTTNLAATLAVQLLEMGHFAGGFCAFYALMVARGFGGKAVAWALWLFWLLMAVGTGARNNTLVVALPAVALLFLKYNVWAASMLRLISVRAYVLGGALAIVMFVLVQYQGYFRTVRFDQRDASKFEVTEVIGNTMFTEGLLGYRLVPETRDHLYNTFPGAALLRPIPQTIFDFAVGFVPRPLWPGKPVNEIAIWYSRTVTGSNADIYAGQGLTGISRGIVGHWYFPYGPIGVIEGGLFFGWLLAVGERAIRNNYHRPLVVLFALGFLNFMFRSFRDLTFIWLYPLVIGAALMWIAVTAHRMLLAPGPGATAGPADEGGATGHPIA